MIGIEALSVYIPNNSIDNRKRLEQFDITADFLEKKTGMIYVARRGESEDTSDMCCTVIERLLTQEDINREEIDCLVVCTQNPDGFGLPHTSAIVHGKMNLPVSCAVFDVSLGCSGYIYGLSIIKSFMEGNGFKKGLLVTADPYSKVLDETDKNTSLLFGDGATATLMTDTPKWEIGKFCLGSDGTQNQAIMVDSATRTLVMNGRGVFNFAATVVPGNITQTLEANGVGKDDISLFLLHQGSRFICTTLTKRLDLPENKVPFMAKNYGNVVSSSIPVMLAECLNHGPNILLSGFGVGLSWGSVVIKWVDQREKTMELNFEKIKKLIQIAGVNGNVSALEPDTTFESIGLDSLDVFNILLSVEESFDVKIPEERIDELSSINKIIDFLNS